MVNHARPHGPGECATSTSLWSTTVPATRVTTADGPVSSEPFTRVYPAAKINVGWAF